jgi:ABC-2 type transport system permease protein
VVIFVVGNIFGIGSKGGNPGPSGLQLAVVDETHSEIVAKMIEAIDSDKAFRVIRGKAGKNEEIIPFSEQDVRDGIIKNEYRFALGFPKESLSQGFGFKVKLLQNPRNGIETQVTEGLVQKNSMTAYFENIWDLPILKADPEVVKEWNETMIDLIVEFWEAPEEDIRAVFREDSFIPDFQKMIAASDSTDGDAKEGGSDGGSSNLFGQIMNVEKENLVGNEIKNPRGVETVSGYSVMFMLFTLTGMASSLLRKNRQGFFFACYLRRLRGRTSYGANTCLVYF